MSADQPADSESNRKIIHIDMDCFYAAIEVRDDPSLRGKPVAVGGRSSNRGVLTTCNYEAREFGCHSAMPTFKALQLCPQLIVVPTRFAAYKEESANIREIFHRFTDFIEPLSLDEAYLDVSHWRSTASAIAEEIRYEIREETGLTASAGIAPNKLLAKIASDWQKPDGQYEVTQESIAEFMETLSVKKIWGVGGKTAEKLARRGIDTCGDLQQVSLLDLDRMFGKFGVQLYHLSRGQDERPVRVNRERKSVSNERTFRENLTNEEACQDKMDGLHAELLEDLKRHEDRKIRSLVVKMKYGNFTKTTVERKGNVPDLGVFRELLSLAWSRGDGKSVRLLGAGVRFVAEARDAGQLEMDLDP